MGSIFFLFKGKNIFISDNIEEILAFVDEQTQGYVVQKYIENPLLLDNNRKFDIRWEEVLILTSSFTTWILIFVIKTQQNRLFSRWFVIRHNWVGV